MATLEALGLTLAVGVFVMILAVLFFGLAVWNRSVLIAPRATARPRNVIYDPHPRTASQDRGSPWFGWIQWTLGLSYDTMLQGVPGTGTREGGLSGPMLKVNMDGIVLLRFHALCLRISVVATALCLAFLLPLYYTAKCYGNEAQLSACSPETYNVTNYQRVTISNVPAANSEAKEAGVNGGILARLYMTSICFFALIMSVLYFLQHEWVQILALRRVYYLERDHWAQRRTELQCSMLYDEVSKEKETQKQHFSFEEDEERRKGTKRVVVKEASFGSEEHLEHRDPWIPHPEQRDTVPNVSLYSLLVGGLPSLPSEAIEHLDTEAAIDYSKRQSIDWQLSLTATFFDHCVPNQPGFSSSVAAVTIIPGAKVMSLAWRKWYAAASKLRRLRFLRRQIEERRRYSIEIDEDDKEDEEEEYVSSSQYYEAEQEIDDVPPRLGTDDVPATPTPRPIYRDLSKRQSYFRKVLGSSVTNELDSQVYGGPSFGPEQASVYSREFAQAAASCCPNGCGEGRVRKARIDELLEMEREAAEDVHLANLELNEVRREITLSTPPDQASSKAFSFNNSSMPSLTLTASNAARLDLDLEADLYEKATSEKKVPSTNTVDQTTLQSVKKVLSCEVGREPTTSPVGGGLASPDWQKANFINSHATDGTRTSERSAEISTGMWALQAPSVKSLGYSVVGAFNALKHWILKRSADAVDSVARDTTYAIVTFTSRQAAVAARNCLADGRGGERWLSVRYIPIPPLSDAPACDVVACRNCLRPVTISISNRQKNVRQIVTFAMLFAIYCLYTVPLTLATQLVSPDSLKTIFPNFDSRLGSLGISLETISGLLSAGIYSLFFSFCPLMFKAISNFGSGAFSAAQAEFRALQYYWWFMVVTAFSANLLATMTINAINNGLQFGSELQQVVVSIANSVPMSAFTWLNWIILRFTITLPVNYLLTVNSFLFSLLGWRCCMRAVIGGGPGGPTPYRLYVDSGVVLLCTLALAPASPLVAPAATFYFLVCTPLLRRNLIYMYRPKFDTGGARWCFLFDMVISCIIVGIVLTAIQLSLKVAIGPAIISALPIVPTLMFNRYVNQRYKPAYNDAALLQTSLLDGWDTASDQTPEQREEFRRFLVDAHKAAYIPVCIVGPDLDGFITAEPAVALPLETDAEPEERQARDTNNKNVLELEEPAGVQHGATLRRAAKTSIAMLRMRKSSTPSALAVPTVMEGEECNNESESAKGD